MQKRKDMNQNEIVEAVEKEIDYCFKNHELLLEAITHSSYTNEMKINKRPHYERLEFLGDAVLELISSEFLYEKFPTVPEGGLTKKRAAMVCEPSLAYCARSMNLGKYIFFGKGEEGAGGRERDSILADVTEAILGAIYLDAGIEAAREYTNTHILNYLKEQQLFVDSKTFLQEMVQHLPNSEKLEYVLIEESGPEHDKTFVMEARIGNRVLSTGKGKTKKTAQQRAAYEAIKMLQNN